MPDAFSPPAARPRRARRWLLLVPLLLLVFVAAGLVWASTPWGAPMPEAEAALVSDAAVTVTRGRWLVFTPAVGAPVAGLVFYPGAKVLPESYAPWAHELAAQGYLVALLSAPLNFAILDPGAAAEVFAAYPDVPAWAVGGHSLGGVAAAGFARSQASVAGLVLMASLPADGDSLAGRDDLAVSLIYGSKDGLFDAADVAKARTLLPSSTAYVEIVGGNHGQFGSYGLQNGDGVAEISRADQQAQIVSATAALLAAIAEPAG